MATVLYEHMLATARRLAKDFGRKLTKGRLVRAVKVEGLSETENAEIEKASLQRTAKQVLRSLKSAPNLFEWAGVDPPSIREIDTAIEQLDWEIDQYEKAIKNFTKLRDRGVKKRELLLMRQHEERP